MPNIRKRPKNPNARRNVRAACREENLATDLGREAFAKSFGLKSLKLTLGDFAYLERMRERKSYAAAVAAIEEGNPA